jgi:type VI secretion system FHA domain protein
LSTEDAIENLFVKSRKAYLSATEAADEAFADIADHQLALFNGIRAAYDELMGQFSPERLEKRFERQRGKSLFGGSGKKWEAYQNFIEELNEDQERTFKHLFGEVFAEQYERSFEALKAKRRK